VPAAKRPARSPNGYTWDDALRRYRDPRGRIVARDTVRSAIDAALRKTDQRARALSLELRAGTVSLTEWEAGMRAVIKDVHLYGAAAVRGGWDRLTPGDLGRVGQLVRTQYAYLEDFAAAIASGRQPLNGTFLNRAGMYAEAGRGTHEAFTQSDTRKEAAARGGVLEARNLLGDAHHCDECPPLTRRGWIPDAEMPLPGHRECRTRCKCRVERRIRGGTEPDTRAKARRRRPRGTDGGGA
jgi:hypothetical protein